MILFKACPRCGGDIDITYADDVHCVQCGHRPEAVYPRHRATEHSTRDDGALTLGFAADRSSTECRRCAAVDLVRLEQLRTTDNTCHRCDHIFSPATTAPGQSPRAAQLR